MRFDTVLDLDSRLIFKGQTDETVLYLESITSVELLWVVIGETGDIVTASEYLDLAT